MIPIKLYRRAESSGYVWPDSGNGVVGSNVGDMFAPRPFAPHIVTVGYDYDFHRGLDINLDEGDTVCSPCGGTIIRMYYTHFGFESDTQLNYWIEDQDGGASSATFIRSGSNIVITGTRGGVGVFPNVAKYKTTIERIALATQFEFRVKLGIVGALTAGKLGFAIIDEITNQYIGLEWDGTNATALGVGSGGNVTSYGTNKAVTTEEWFRFLLSSGTLSWDVSTDGSTWTNIASEAMPAFTSSQKIFVPILYWRSTDINTPAIEIYVDFAGWRDDDTIGRFGNWMFIKYQMINKFMLAHFQSIDVKAGDIIEAGQTLGKAGMTGFDERSGPVLYPHSHLEYITSLSTLYNNDDPTNPLGPSIMPRVNVSNNVTVTRSTANDPDGVSCWRLRVQVARADSDFDMNEISLTGTTAARTINFNTRSGLNVDNDIPKNNGVYIVPEDFDYSSTIYEISFYFKKSTVGSTFVSAYIKDTDGTTLWSE